MKTKNRLSTIYENRTLLIYVVAGILILYGAYKQLLVFAGFRLDIFTTPIAWYLSVIYIAILFIGVQMFRLKASGWFGGNALFFIMFLINFTVVLSLPFFVIFNKQLLQTFPSLSHILSFPITFNSKVVFSIGKIILYGFVLKLLFEKEIIEGYRLQKFKKIALWGIVILMSIFSLSAYVGGYWIIK